MYTIVRIKSVIRKYVEGGNVVDPAALMAPCDDYEKNLMLEISKFNEVMENAFDELAPHKICAFIYAVSNAFNSFYHETRILGQEDKKRLSSQIALLDITKRVLEKCIDVLGFSAPDAM